MDPLSLRQVGPYPVVRFIAEGGFAWVFEVVDPRFDARRALKVLKPTAAAGDELLRFQAEVMLLARLDHPNLITVFEFGRDAPTGCHYYVMSLIDGPNLQQLIQEQGPLPIDQAGPLFLDALKGLSALHDANIVHRDIKPSNILVTRDGLGKLGDLGIARVRGESGRTRTNTAIGTELYMSPEQARGQTVGPQSDVFSLGLTLYQVLTGHTVYEEIKGLDSTSGHDVLMYMGSLIHSGKQLVFHFPKNVPRGVARLIRRACDLDASRRYADAREMHDALEEAIAGDEATVGLSPARVAIAALGVLAVAGATFWWMSRPPRLDPQAVLRQANELERKASEAVAAVAELESPPTPLLAALRPELEDGVRMQELAQAEIRRGNEAGALAMLPGAIRQYDTVCARLLAEHLAARADADAQAAASAAAALDAGGAGQLRPEAWARIQASLAAVGGPPAPGTLACDGAVAQAARATRAGEALTSVRSLERTLQDQWPELARTGREGALEAQRQALADPAQGAEHQSALTEGRLQLSRGDGARAAGRFLDARDAYGRAQKAFQDAAAIAPAARARAEARQLPENASLAPTLASADALFAAQRWTEAAAEYTRAIQRWQTLSRADAASSDAMAAAVAAETARDAALRDGALVSADAELARGDRLRGAAQDAFDQQQLGEAARRYAEAKAAYAAAQQTARKAVGVARGVGDGVRKARRIVLDGKDCTALHGDESRRLCELGQEALAQGDDALGKTDAPQATMSYTRARDLFDRARKSEQDLGPPPAPPTLARVRPAEPLPDQAAAGARASVAPSSPPPPSKQPSEVATLRGPPGGPSRAIERYKEALEARNIVSLQGVWPMSPELTSGFVRLFRECQQVAVRIDARAAEPASPGASIDFTQVLACDGTARPPDQLRAQLIERSDGQWQIKSLKQIR